MKRQQLNQEKIEGLLTMIVESGASNAGEMPPVEYTKALMTISKPYDKQRIIEAYRDNVSPTN